ncbi:MAG TPA: DMT family transporter [Mycobacterium sp.]|nr:DMT family transporter [Mycobacterium sp.]
MHQRSAHDVTDERVGHFDLFLRLIRDGQWWLGSVVAAVGFALQAAALGLGRCWCWALWCSARRCGRATPVGRR